MDVALKEYLEAQIDALRREMKQQRESDWKALDLARDNLTLRLESMNEFRAQILRERDDYVRADTFRWIVGVILAVAVLVSPLMARLWR